jgi:hypothetical protein
MPAARLEYSAGESVRTIVPSRRSQGAACAVERPQHFCPSSSWRRQPDEKEPTNKSCFHREHSQCAPAPSRLSARHGAAIRMRLARFTLCASGRGWALGNATRMRTTLAQKAVQLVQALAKRRTRRHSWACLLGLLAWLPVMVFAAGNLAFHVRPWQLGPLLVPIAVVLVPLAYPTLLGILPRQPWHSPPDWRSGNGQFLSMSAGRELVNLQHALAAMEEAHPSAHASRRHVSAVHDRRCAGSPRRHRIPQWRHPKTQLTVQAHFRLQRLRENKLPAYEKGTSKHAG